jgi:recombination protein RecR
MNPLDQLIQIMSRLPGLGPRSARRAVLHLMRKRETLLPPLIAALEEVERTVKTCSTCFNLDSGDPCAICRDPSRDRSMLCVVADVGDLWALERAGIFKGRYHVLGGVLSALDGIGPEQLSVGALLQRVEGGGVGEIILAMGATVDGQTTSHYLADRLQAPNLTVSRLAHGVPMGGELDYLDDGTLVQAMKARQRV